VDSAADREVAQLVDGLTRIVRHRDPDAAAHLEATAVLAERLGRELDLPGHVIYRVRIGGRLHDLGMLSIPSEIAAKRGKPDRHERRELEMHPIYGASILDGFPPLRTFAEIVRSHHERVDGTGYPYGLPEYDIPLEAKIVGIAEAFHAMTSDRPYAPARLPQEALAEIHASRGTQFDPVIVEALCRLMRWEPGTGAATTRPA
jgi:HD-GYP domain-containing protein (c-di-GMP phosphodiesterase class II)